MHPGGTATAVAAAEEASASSIAGLRMAHGRGIWGGDGTHLGERDRVRFRFRFRVREREREAHAHVPARVRMHTAALNNV